MLVSFPFSAFFGMHLIATIFPVAFSRAITTSENAPLQERGRETRPLYMRWDNIDTENLITREEMEGTQRQTAQSTQTAYCEYLLRTGKVPDCGQQPSVLAYAWCLCAAKHTANTFKTSRKKKKKKQHPFRTADSVSSSAICLHT